MNPNRIDNNSDDKSRITWGFGTNTLDDWLENDLKHSSLFQRGHSKCSLNHIMIQNNESINPQSITIKPEEPDIKSVKQEEPNIKAVRQELIKDHHPKSLPANLIPLIKVYSLLHAIKQNELIAKDTKHHHMINAPAHPSPTSSITRTTDTNNKKRRVNSRTSVDSKRQKNTAAARRSRLKKANMMGSLETKVGSLQNNNERLRVKVAVLETEVNFAAEKEQRNRQRVLDLEVQLAMTHKKLVEDYKNGE